MQWRKFRQDLLNGLTPAKITGYENWGGIFDRDIPRTFVRIPQSLAAWTYGSREVFRIQPSLQAMLELTTVRGLTWGDILWPYHGYAITLERPIRREDGLTVKTSNPDAAIVQDVILQDGKPLWRYVLDLTVNRWNTAGNMIPVIASTADIDLREVRAVVPDNTPILFAGYGSQGGQATRLRDLIDSAGRGVFVNSSRALLYPYEVNDPDWRNAIVQATLTMRDDLNFARSRSKFLLILGVSGVGKSAIIRELRKLDSRFVCISPYMTRTLRPDETDKVSIDDGALDEMSRNNQLLVVNELYGVRYATPRQPIERAFREDRFPLLDWPVDRLEVMQQEFPDRLFRVYIEPPDIDSLKRRLADGRDPTEQRLDAAKAEITTLASGAHDSAIDYRTVNRDGEVDAIANEIYQAYLKTTGL